MSDKYGEDKPWQLTQESDEAPSYEELEERLKAATDDAKEAEAYAEELEAKLAKAVEALEGLIELHSLSTNEINPKSVLEFARTTLAELSKELSDEKGETK